MVNKDTNKLSTRAYMLIGISCAFMLAVPVLILLFIGTLLDTLFHTKPLITLFGAVAGSVSGIMNVLKILRIVQNPEFKKRVLKEKKSIMQKNKLQS